MGGKHTTANFSSVILFFLRRWVDGNSVIVIIVVLLPLSLSFPLPFPLSSVVEDGGLSVGDGMVGDGRRCFGGIGGGGS